MSRELRAIRGPAVVWFLNRMRRAGSQACIIGSGHAGISKTSLCLD